MEDILNISAHKYGNYHKYYEFHPAATRTSVLDRSGESIFYNMWKAQKEPATFRLLDVGCNEGDLSMDLYHLVVKQLPSSVKVTLLGIDIDSSLIDLANKKYTSESSDGSIVFKSLNCMETSEVDSYFKEYFAGSDSAGFSFIAYFSITMWIHLNHNDSGLIRFLTLGAQLLTPLGTLLVEPQPWKCYKAAVKRSRKLGLAKPLYYDDIQLKDIDSEVVKILMDSKDSESHGMKSYQSLGKEVWGRSLLLFHRSEYVNLQLDSSADSRTEKEKEEESSEQAQKKSKTGEQ